jgi:hypothetical protein
MLTWKIKNYTEHSDHVDVEWEASVTINNNTVNTFGQIGLTKPDQTITEELLIDLVKQLLGAEEVTLFETALTAQAKGGVNE